MIKTILVAGPVIVENGKVLLNKDDRDDFWKFCGGQVEDYDLNLKETVKREAREEMGLEIEILDNQPYFFYLEKEIDGEKTSIELAHFLAKRIGEIKPGGEIKAWQWLALTDLDKEKLAPNIKPALKYFGF